MLVELPIVIWKCLLSHIYSAHQARSGSIIRCTTSSDIISDNRPIVYKDTLIIKHVLVLRQVCKYIRDTVLTPAMCQWVMANYRFDPSHDLIVAIPRPSRFIELMWSDTVDRANTTLRDDRCLWSALQWVRALSFTIASKDYDSLMMMIEEYRDLSWTVYLLDDVYDVYDVYDSFCIRVATDLELIGQRHTTLVISWALNPKVRSSLCLRNLAFYASNPNDPCCSVISGQYDILILDNCSFESKFKRAVNVSCKKLAVVGCCFLNQSVGIRYQYELVHWLVDQVKKQDRLVYICRNRFVRCTDPIKLKSDMLVADGCDLDKVVWISDNEGVVL